MKKNITSIVPGRNMMAFICLCFIKSAKCENFGIHYLILLYKKQGFIKQCTKTKNIFKMAYITLFFNFKDNYKPDCAFKIQILLHLFNLQIIMSMNVPLTFKFSYISLIYRSL